MSIAHDIAIYYGQGKEEKNRDGWVTCCPVHGDKNPSLSIWDDASNGGVNVDCKVGCNFKDIKDRFRSDGLLPEWEPEKKNGKKTFTRTKKPYTQPEVDQDTPSNPEKKSFAWEQASRKNLEHAKRYFSNRAITIDLPICLRWGSYKEKDSGETKHTVVAAASRPDDDAVYAVQRLFIDLETYKKEDGRMLGECEGRGVWFDRKGDKTEIVIGEGIETTLSVIQSTDKKGVAALSTSGMKNLIIPDETEVIYILVDSDPVREVENKSMPGQKAAYTLAVRFTSSRVGRTAFLVSPDDTCFTDNPNKIDFNDLLKTDPTGETIRARIESAINLSDLKWIPPTSDQGADDTGDGNGFYPEETLAALREMNKEYAAVLLGGDFRIAKEGFDAAAKKHTLSFLKMTSLYSYYANSKVQVNLQDKGIEVRELAKLWMGWEGRRTYDDVVFDPSENSGPNTYNLFKGFPLEPKLGDWSMMRNHIFEVICDSNADHFAYVMAWMARAVQDPGGDKPGVAIVLKGGKGIGKGVFVNYFGSIFGEAFLPIADSESFTGRFNMHLSKSLLVFLDEAVWGGDKKAEGKLKQLITESTILFEPKGIDSITLNNFINVIIASNEEWVVPATGDERRFCVLQPSETFKQNTEYFGKIIKERKNGGAEAMMYDLLRYDYSDVDLRTAPLTDGLSDQVQQSLPDVHDFWHSLIDRGYLLSHPESGRPQKSEYVPEFAPINDAWPNEVWKYEIYAEYTRWCRVKNERYVKNEVHFWKNTWQIWASGIPKRQQRKGNDGKILDTVIIPTIDEAKKAFTLSTKIKFSHEETADGVKQIPIPFDDQF